MSALRVLDSVLGRAGPVLLLVLATATAILGFLSARKWILLRDEQAGVAALQHGDVAGALVRLRRAARSGQASASTHYWFGVALLQSGDEESAIAEFRTALAEQGKTIPFSSAHFELGTALLQTGRLVGAKSELSTALRSFPGYAEDLVKVGDRLDAKGMRPAAEAAWTVVVERGPPPWSERAQARLRGRRDE